MKKPWILSYTLSAQRRLWSDWAGAQADLSLRWAHSHFVCFVMSRLRFGNNVQNLPTVFCNAKAGVKRSPVANVIKQNERMILTCHLKLPSRTLETKDTCTRNKDETNTNTLHILTLRSVCNAVYSCSLLATCHVIRGCDQVRLKTACSVIETS